MATFVLSGAGKDFFDTFLIVPQAMPLFFGSSVNLVGESQKPGGSGAGP
jgi:hypothetical protein